MPILAEAWTWQQTLLMATGILILGGVMYRMTRQRQAARGQLVSGSGTRAARSAETLRDQLDALMVQLEELARSTSAQIETRYTKLEVLLEEADRKIAQLESLLVNVSRSGQPEPAIDPVKPEHRRIRELADAGRTPVQIAQETGRDVGEVELILALRKNRH
jgi:hypothetical protein